MRVAAWLIASVLLVAGCVVEPQGDERFVWTRTLPAGWDGPFGVQAPVDGEVEVQTVHAYVVGRHAEFPTVAFRLEVRPREWMNIQGSQVFALPGYVTATVGGTDITEPEQFSTRVLWAGSHLWFHADEPAGQVEGLVVTVIGRRVDRPQDKR